MVRFLMPAEVSPFLQALYSASLSTAIWETIPERGQTERLGEKSLCWCRPNRKMILFQQGRTLPLFWNGLQQSHGHRHVPHRCILPGDSHVSALEVYSSVLEKEVREESDASHSVA